MGNLASSAGRVAFAGARHKCTSMCFCHSVNLVRQGLKGGQKKKRRNHGVMQCFGTTELFCLIVWR